MRIATLVCVLALPGCFDDNVGFTDGDLVPHPPQLQTRWVVSIGGDYEDGINSLALDPSGDVIVGGGFQHTADFGSGLIESSHPRTVDGTYNSTAFVTKRSGADGSEVWTTIFDDGVYADAIGIATDSSANTYVAGMFPDSTNTDTAQLIKLDVNGNERWRYEIDRAAIATAQTVTVAADGTIYFAGWFQGTIDVGMGPVSAPFDLEASSFVVALSPDNELRWGRTFLGKANILSIAETTEGNLVFGGNLNGPTTFDLHVLEPIDRADSFVVSYDANGEYLWGHVSAAFGMGPGVTDPTVAGGYVTVLSDSAIGVVCHQNDDLIGLVMVRTFTSNGTPTGQSLVHGAIPLAAAAGSSGEVLIGGSINDFTADFGNGPLAGNLFVASAAADAAPTGGVTYGSVNSTGTIRSMAAASSSLVVGASLGDGYDFGTGPVPFAGGWFDAVIVMFDQGDP